MNLVTTQEIGNGVLLITLSDPDNLNAMSEKMAGEFKQVVQDLKTKENNLRAVILTGAGRAFSAGGDLEMLKNKSLLTGEENRNRMLSFYDSFLSIRKLKVPIIAAINGHAIGAGLCVATACDIRIAAEGAKLGFTFTRLALHPGMGATYFLPQVIGIAKATELLLTGRIVLADEALRLGLVSEVCESTAILDRAKGIANEIMQCGKEATRQLLESLRMPQASMQQALEREALCQSIDYASAEFKEGVQATIEKRQPKWS